jgi:hypothetical protein
MVAKFRFEILNKFSWRDCGRRSVLLNVLTPVGRDLNRPNAAS